MKKLRFFAVSAALLAVVACSSKGENAGAQSDSLQTEAAVKPSKALADSVSYFLGINYGSMLKQYDFADIDYSLMVKGMKDYMGAKGNEQDSTFLDQFKYDPSTMGDVINRYISQHSQYKASLAAAQEKKFFASNKSKAGVEETESGLQYIIKEAGSENKPTNVKDTVYVHYKGSLLDGTVFDEVKDDAASVHFTLDRVISGWREGLQLIGEGGKATLYVPSSLGYGVRAMGVIPANSTLVFDVQLDSVKHYVAPATEEAAK